MELLRDLVLKVSFNMGPRFPSLLLERDCPSLSLSRSLTPPILSRIPRHSSATLFARYYEFRNIIRSATCFHDIEFQARYLYNVQCKVAEYLTYLLLRAYAARFLGVTSCRGKCRKLHGWFCLLSRWNLFCGVRVSRR